MRQVTRQEFYRASVVTERQFLLPDDVSEDYDPDEWDQYETHSKTNVEEILEGPIDSHTISDDPVSPIDL